MVQRLGDAGWIAAAHALTHRWLGGPPAWSADQTIATAATVLAFYVSGEVAGLCQARARARARREIAARAPAVEPPTRPVRLPAVVYASV